MCEVWDMNRFSGYLSDKTHFARSLKLFKECGENTLDEIIQSSYFKKLPKGTFLFFQNDPAEEMFLIRSGAIAIELDSPDGRELVINELRTGDFLGELALLTGLRRSTSAIAIVDSEVLVIPKEVFLKALNEEPRLGRQVLDIVALRLRASSEREAALAFMGAEARLARVLLNLDKREHDRGYITISQDELAQRAGLTRQTVAKTLGRWRRAGWLLTGRGRIMLLRVSAIKTLEDQG
jgi:CRP/FNR family cyclic AMP-dependent transcriptional regulator